MMFVVVSIELESPMRCVCRSSPRTREYSLPARNGARAWTCMTLFIGRNTYAVMLPSGHGELVAQ
eukprot:3244824-Alexandrium_andersonii.AAC.1